jgi:hypothetical protein
MTTYDKIMHTVGLIALGLLGLSSNPSIYSHLPWWLMALASVTAFATQVSTMPVTDRPVGMAKAMASSNAGKVASLVLLLSFLGAFTACPPSSTTPGGNTAGSLDAGPTPVANFDACSEKVIQDKTIGLIGLIAQATVGGDYMEALETLGVKYGVPEIECAAQLFVDTMKRKAAMDETAMLQRERAQMWLAKKVTSGP